MEEISKDVMDAMENYMEAVAKLERLRARKLGIEDAIEGLKKEWADASLKTDVAAAIAQRCKQRFDEAIVQEAMKKGLTIVE